ncbi:cytochrome c oxidase assembly protein [Aestuariivirga sp.]|uniref:cytochrome c oxidase assembly protein n=1 Tax=Aestuariivirga sp. TaxID=2650926 RepID=UPI0039E39EA7
MNRNRRVALIATVMPVAMLALAYASVPLYRMFCQATGFNGTPLRAEKAPAKPGDEIVTVRFDSNIAGSLDWNFHPAQATMQVRVGEQAMAYFKAKNLSDHQTTGSAIFNVTPDGAGAFFNKIQCFCFTEQTLKPGESVDMPVVFFVDPAIATDPESKSIREITLSYTMYPVDKPKSVSQAKTAAGAVPN